MAKRSSFLGHQYLITKEKNIMRIAIVSPYPPSMGTLNEYAYHLINHFKRKSELEEILILTDTIDESYTEVDGVGGCKVTIVPCWTFNKLTNFLSIAKAVKKYDVDVVLYNIQFLSFGDRKIAGALGLLTPLMTRMMGTPSVTLLHNITETVDYESAGITKSPIMKSIYGSIGTVLTKLLLMSNMMAVTMPKYVKILEKKYGAKNVALVPHGSFEVLDIPVASDPVVKQVMTFGKFGTYKKVEEMIEAVDLVRQRTGESIEIVIAGTDNPNAKGYLDDVQKQYAHIDDITYTGYVDEADVPRIFSESSVVVFPYTSTTGSSGVLHQAGSYGKSVVLPNLGDLKELIEEEGYQGEYFQPADVESMAEAIEKLVVDTDRRNKMGMCNYLAASSLPMSDIADWYLLHFEQLSGLNLYQGQTRDVRQKTESTQKNSWVPQRVVTH